MRSCHPSALRCPGTSPFASLCQRPLAQPSPGPAGSSGPRHTHAMLFLSTPRFSGRVLLAATRSLPLAPSGMAQPPTRGTARCPPRARLPRAPRVHPRGSSCGPGVRGTHTSTAPAEAFPTRANIPSPPHPEGHEPRVPATPAPPAGAQCPSPCSARPPGAFARSSTPSDPGFAAAGPAGCCLLSLPPSRGATDSCHWTRLENVG